MLWCASPAWAEETVRVILQVPPKRRRHVVIGPRGEMIRKLLCQEYPSVRVSVPPPLDSQCQEVTLDGLKSQVIAAARHITHHLEAIEAQLRRPPAKSSTQEGVGGGGAHPTCGVTWWALVTRHSGAWQRSTLASG